MKAFELNKIFCQIIINDYEGIYQDECYFFRHCHEVYLDLKEYEKIK